MVGKDDDIIIVSSEDGEIGMAEAGSIPPGGIADLNIHAKPGNPVQGGAWLITFTDIMALMLTFFVLLFSMSVPDEGAFKKMLPEQRDASKFMGARHFSGEHDVISIGSKKRAYGLDLGYLSTILLQLSDEGELMKGLKLIRNADRLVISLPDTISFKKGAVDLSDDAKQRINALASVLSKIENQIIVVGHADPSGSKDASNYWLNWDVSMRRAQQVAMALNAAGVEQNIIIRGLSRARFEELPNDLAPDIRMNLARRVDIIIRPNRAK